MFCSELAVEHRAFPNFAHFPVPKQVQTPDTFGSRFDTDLESSPELAEKTFEEAYSDLMNNRFEHVSLGLGTGYNHCPITSTSEASHGLDVFGSQEHINSIVAQISSGAANYTSKVQSQMEGDSGMHNFPREVDIFAKYANTYVGKGGDGKDYLYVEIEGGRGNLDGIFQYIAGTDGSINHRKLEK